jgi:uncharacterized protein
MSELINNSEYMKEKPKELILKLHQGENPLQARTELIRCLVLIILDHSMDCSDGIL